MPPPPSFLTLPPDLRQRIYTHLLVSPTPIKGPSARKHQNETYHIHTSILRVNKQINTEARLIFFGLNTFHITSLPPLPAHSAEEEDDASGAFEPPLQLKDLSLVRTLDVDLVYWGRPGCTGAERYASSLGFVLGACKGSLAEVRVVGDARPYATASSPSSSSAMSMSSFGGLDDEGEEVEEEYEEEGEKRELDVKTFLTGFHAASTSWRFQDALAGLAIDEVRLRFEFPEIYFDFMIEKDVLLKKNLAHVAGQVLVARTEIGIKETLRELDGPEGHEMEFVMG